MKRCNTSGFHGALRHELYEKTHAGGFSGFSVEPCFASLVFAAALLQQIPEFLEFQNDFSMSRFLHDFSNSPGVGPFNVSAAETRRQIRAMAGELGTQSSLDMAQHGAKHVRIRSLFQVLAVSMFWWFWWFWCFFCHF